MIGATSLPYGARVRAQDVPADPRPDVPALPAIVDPTIEALLETKPTTPAEMVRLARVLVDLNALEPAKSMIAQVIAAQPDAETLAGFSDRFGTATFVNWKLRPELNPEATQLADAVLAAASQTAADPARIAALIEQLGNPDHDERRAAVELLRSGRADSVKALLAVLTDPTRAALHEHVKTALVGQRQEAFGPLLAALTAPDATLRAQVVEVLGRSAETSVSDHLLAPALAPDEPAAVRTSAQAALRSLLGQVPRPVDAALRLYRHALQLHEGKDPLARASDLPAAQDDLSVVEIWTWDTAANQVVLRQGTAKEAAMLLAARLAGDARRLEPNSRAIRRLHLAALLESAAVHADEAGPLPAGADSAAELAAAEGVVVVNDLLSYSAASGHISAAVGAATILGRLGDAQMLHQSGARPCPLAEAMRHQDRRVRFAAVGAVMTIDPRRPYPGSSYLPKALKYFLTSAGRPRALVAGINPQEAQRQAGMLIELGYDVHTVYAAADIQRAAASSSDHELLLVDVTMAWPNSGELIQRLRRDGRTARMPIVVVASLNEKRRAERLALRQEWVEAIVRPPGPEALQFQIAPLLARGVPDHVSAERRLQQAATAVRWAAQLTGEEAGEARHRLYDLSCLERPLLDALWVPELGARAADVLARLGKPAGQRALVEMASRASQSIDLRQASANAFRDSVRHHGILLTSSEMLLQYDRYNQSETLDEATQAVLGSILDTLEGP